MNYLNITNSKAVNKELINRVNIYKAEKTINKSTKIVNTIDLIIFSVSSMTILTLLLMFL